jgi:hypothetical protein
MDPILWTKKERSFATLLQVFLTGNFDLLLPLGPLTVSPSCRVKRRLALLASNQPRDSPAEGTPMAFPLCHAEQGTFFPTPSAT